MQIPILLKMTSSQKIYEILLPLKQKTLDKINKNLNEEREKLNILKGHVPEILVYGTFERTFSTCLGHKLQEIASACGNNVINVDQEDGKTLGIDIRTDFGEGQMKLGKNTQTGTHKKDSINKLIETTKQNNTNPFFVTALGESYEYVNNGILYIGGNKFWDKIGVDYDELYDGIVRVIRETYEEVKSTIIPNF